MQKQLKVLGVTSALVAACFTLVLSPAAAAEKGYWDAAEKGTVWKTGFGECWQAEDGKPNAACAGKKEAPPEAPVKVSDGDDDGDGVPNSRDKCPGTPKGARVDENGCELPDVINLKGVLFDFDKATLRPEGRATLDNAAALFQKHPDITVEVAGHTDSRGSDSYNQKLSLRRANSVKAYLSEQGIAASRMTVKGFGESSPVTSNKTAAGRAQNRRVELVIQK
jgi:outer membrane protein OmpA-like peptidoglycan-associated protein